MGLLFDIEPASGPPWVVLADEIDTLITQNEQPGASLVVFAFETGDPHNSARLALS
jgi:hypothetical protein